MFKKKQKNNEAKAEWYKKEQEDLKHNRNCRNVKYIIITIFKNKKSRFNKVTQLD